MKKQPLVSVIMPVYNAEKYLKDAIKSILKQTYDNFELIIINDASTDNSTKIISHYKKLYPKIIKVITLKKNLNRGGDSCANEGIHIAKGKLIARMDADDIAHPKRLEKQVIFLQKNPDIFLVGTNANVINDKGKIIGEKTEPLNHQDIYRSYFTFHPIIHPSAMYRRMLNSKRFEYQIKFSANNDYYTFFKLLCKGIRYANLKEKLLYYRIHQTNDTFVKIKEKFSNTIKTRKEMFFHYQYEPNLKQVLITFIQAIILFSLPEKLTKYLYLISKGIIKLNNPFNKLLHLRKIYSLGLKTKIKNLLSSQA